MSGGAALRELSSVLAGNAELASEKIGVILCQCPAWESLQDGSTRLNARHLNAVLAVAQFLVQSAGLEFRLDLWKVVLEFLRAIPSLSEDDFWFSAISSHAASCFFSDFMAAVMKITEMNSVLSEEVSNLIADIIRKVTTLSHHESSTPISPGIKFFLLALSQSLSPLLASDVEKVIKCLVDQWAVSLQSGTPRPSSSDTSSHSSPSVSNKSHRHSGLSNGNSSPYKEPQEAPGTPQYKQMNGSGFVSRYDHHPNVPDGSPNSTSSTTPVFTPISTPSKLVDEHITTRPGQLNGTSTKVGLDYFYAAQSESPQDGGSSVRLYRVALEGVSLHVLERQEIAFRLASQILEKPNAWQQFSDVNIVQLRNTAVTQLKGVLSLLKIRRQDWPTDGEDLKTKLDLKLRACQGATVLKTRCLLISESNAKSKGSLRESFPLLLDAADVCLASPWRKLKSCEDLLDSLLHGVAQIAVVLGNQRSVLLRLKSVILATCAQAETWGTSQSSVYESMLKASCTLLEASWNSDKSAGESFLLSLAAHIRERVEHGEKERHVVFVQTNLISFLADLAEKFSRHEMGELILPQFIESLEQGDSSVPGQIRLKLIEALARLGSLGCEKSYREVVVLLTQSYLDKVSSLDSAYSRAMHSEGTTEQIDTLASALLQLARGLQQQPKLRADLRERVLTLCSNVGLVAESKNNRSGADLLGPLLPAVAEICSDCDPTEDLESPLLKLFRNLWFYIALFGLAPPVQRGHNSLRQTSTQTGNISSTHSNFMSLQAVGGNYLWNAQWSAAATSITHGTPPLVVSSVKWLEDELELKALHNPDSRRGAGNEKAATTQRAALSAAIGGLVETSCMSTISGVKATYLLAVSFLEILRLRHRGGVLGSLKGGYTTALSCAFKYLETPDLLPVVQQCLEAVVEQAFTGALSWLEERTLLTEEQAEEREGILASHTCFLIRAVAHREERVRDMADTLLGQIRNRFPQVLWNPRCLDEVLRLVADLVATADSGVPVATRALWNQRVREWIAHALILAPCTVQGLLQEQFRKLNNWQKAAQTSDLLSLLSDVRLDSTKTDGWSSNINLPAALAAAAAAAGASPQSTKVGSMEVLSTGIISANIKSNYAGEIAGMKKLYAGMGGLNLGPTPATKHDTAHSSGMKVDENAKGSRQVQGEDSTLHEILTTRFVQLLQQFVVTAERGSDVDPAAFREACLRGAALLLSDTGNVDKKVSEGFDQLLRLLCWCPAHIFTPETMETGVFVWTWLLSASPNLGSRVLAELVDAWLWTVDTKKGLFAYGIENSGPRAKLRPQLTAGVPGPVNDEELVQGISAHQVWLGFILDRFEVVRNVSSDQLFLISRLLQGSVKSATQFSSHPAATGTFFTLILLSLKFCAFQSQVCSGLSNKGINLLEKRSYRAALGWFAVEPGWYDPKVEGVLQAEAKAVAIFVHYLNSKRSQGNFQMETSVKSVQEHSVSNSVSTQGDSAHPVWVRDDDYSERERQRLLLLMLCQYEADRLETWAHPLMKESSAARPKVSADLWSEYVRTAWSVDPRIALSLVTRFRTVAILKAEVTSMVQKHLMELSEIPEAIPYFVTPKAVDEDSPVLRNLLHWAPCSITLALEFLTPDYRGHHRVMAYVLRVMETYPPERVTFFMPQLVQSLRYDQKGLVEGYLMVAAQRSNLFAHILIWQLQGEEPPSSEEASKESEVAKGNLYDIVPKVKQRIIDSFTPEAYDVFVREFDFFDQVTSISGVLYPLPKDERRAGIRRELEKITIPGQDLYLPTAPNKYVRGIQLDSGIPLQSAAKVPIMITFDVVDKDGDPIDVKPQACIFKVGDDCRQDVLALQVIALLRDIYDAVGINLYLFPYGVLPTGYGRGIIEVVPNTRSRNQMGEITDGGLYELFKQDFGPDGSPKFEEARDNFIVSSAGYAVASLLLQPKDRHNGNLLFDKDGRLVHIDFGFILETSPGRNMRFESAHFKLSHEMTQLLDPSGAMKSDTWYRFVSLCVKGYLTARQHMDGIINTVWLMKESGLPCFSRGDPIGNLRKRFHPEMTEREAANFMIKTCGDAYNKWSTAGYDLIQYWQQGIEK